MAVMNGMNDGLHDLNLVRVFLAIWDTRNLTAAGGRLGLTQPAVSHALRRLRDTVGDPLFVRVPGGVTPTDRAARLHHPFQDALHTIQAAVQDTTGFDPATAERTIRVAMSEVSEFVLLPALMPWLARTAPTVRLRVVPLDPTTVLAAMRAGEVDLALGVIPGLENETATHHLFTDSFVCLVRAGHPVTAAATPDLGTLGYVHVDIAAGYQIMKHWLAGIGVKRQVVLRLRHLAAAPGVVRGTDLAVIFPESAARLVNADNAFALLPLPPGHPVIDVHIHVHPHVAADPGITWFRNALLRLFADGHYPAA